MQFITAGESDYRQGKRKLCVVLFYDVSLWGNGTLSHIFNVLLATLKVERKDATYITDV